MWNIMSARKDEISEKKSGDNKKNCQLKKQQRKNRLTTKK